MPKTTTRPNVSILSAALPTLALIASTLGVAWQAGFLAEPVAEGARHIPETVMVAPRTFEYRADGEYFKDNIVIDPPRLSVSENRPLEIMKYQVTTGEYQNCVADGACPAPVAGFATEAGIPVTGVSFDDARLYAEWLSKKTGVLWSLPTDRQLAFAAGRSFPDDALGIDPDNKNPALRWLADYKREAAEKTLRESPPRIVGSFGVNEFGVADFGGNIWEWTTTCQRKVHLDRSGAIDQSESVCGVYVTVGSHRAPMSAFVRDPKGGGCAVGTPPANLGFRLVRDDRWYASLLRKLRIGT